MKKFVALLSAVALLMCGCSEKKKAPEEVMKKSEELFTTAENITVKMVMDMEMEYEGEKSSMKIDANVKMDIKNDIMDMDMSMDMGGMSFDVKTYSEKVDGKQITYTQDLFGDGWTKSTDEEEESTEVSNFIPNGTNIKEVKSDIDGMTKYEMTITADEVNELMGETGDLAGTEEMTFKENVVLEVYVNEEGYIGKMVMDLTDVYETTEGTEENITKCVVTFEFSNLNKTSVSIPEDVKNSAVEEEIYE